MILDLLFPSVKYSEASMAGLSCNINNNLEMVIKSKSQPERDTDFQPNGHSVDVEDDPEIRKPVCSCSSDQVENPASEKMLSLFKMAGLPSKLDKPGPWDRSVVRSPTAEGDVSRNNSPRPYFKPSRLPIRTNRRRNCSESSRKHHPAQRSASISQNRHSDGGVFGQT